tara:strand:- start:218 stop:754 length:537 start_codon:yes stop_codon:yes gene_type:complete
MSTVDGPTPVILISGPVGVGKTSVGDEWGEVLIERDVAHTYLDFDQLCYTYPRPLDDPWGNRLAFEHLAAIWRNARAAGARNLVIPTVVETADFVADLCAVIPGAAPRVFQLRARLETLHERIRKREIGSGLDWHLNRAGELLAILGGPEAPCDARIDTDRRTVRELAEELADRVDWA